MNLSNVLQSLIITGKGMAAIFVVMIVIYLVIALIRKVFRKMWRGSNSPITQFLTMRAARQLPRGAVFMPSPRAGRFR